MKLTTLAPRRSGKHAGPYSQSEAAQVAQRNILIARIHADGEPVANLAVLTGLTRKQIKRILDAAPPSPQRDKPTVTPGEYKELRREFLHDPAKLAWLASVRVDARRNGRPMSNWSPDCG